MNLKADDWVDCISEKDHFRISFPAKYEHESHSTLPLTGTTVYKCKDKDKTYYQVSVTHLIKVFGDPENLLEDALGLMIKDINNAKLKWKKQMIYLKTYPAIAFGIDIKNTISNEGVMFLINNILYTLTISASEIDRTDYNKFIVSFKLI